MPISIAVLYLMAGVLQASILDGSVSKDAPIPDEVFADGENIICIDATPLSEIAAGDISLAGISVSAAPAPVFEFGDANEGVSPAGDPFSSRVAALLTNTKVWFVAFTPWFLTLLCWHLRPVPYRHKRRMADQA